MRAKSRVNKKKQGYDGPRGGLLTYLNPVCSFRGQPGQEESPHQNLDRLHVETHPHSSGCRFLPDGEETLQEQLHPKVRHCRPEEHGTLFTCEDALHVQRLHETRQCQKAR